MDTELENKNLEKANNIFDKTNDVISGLEEEEKKLSRDFLNKIKKIKESDLTEKIKAKLRS